MWTFISDHKCVLKNKKSDSSRARFWRFNCRIYTSKEVNDKVPFICLLLITHSIQKPVPSPVHPQGQDQSLNSLFKQLHGPRKMWLVTHVGKDRILYRITGDIWAGKRGWLWELERSLSLCFKTQAYSAV